MSRNYWGRFQMKKNDCGEEKFGGPEGMSLFRG